MRAVPTVENIILAFFGLGVVWLAAVSLPHWIARSEYKLLPLALGSLRFIGWIPIAIGAAAILWSYGTFVFIGEGTPWPFHPPRKLVVTGPYGLVRNPMESGILLVVFGEMLLLESSAIFLCLVSSFLFLHLRQVVVGEPVLRARFGQPYEQYCKSVPRWVPLLRAPPRET